MRRSRSFRQYFEISFVVLCSQSWSAARRIISTAANHFGALAAEPVQTSPFVASCRSLVARRSSLVARRWSRGPSRSSPVPSHPSLITRDPSPATKPLRRATGDNAKIIRHLTSKAQPQPPATRHTLGMMLFKFHLLVETEGAVAGGCSDLLGHHFA